MRLFYKYNTIDYRLLWDKHHDLKAVTWNYIRKYVELPGLCQIIHAFSKISSADSVNI